MKRTYRHPVTGDPLTLGEYISWMIQGLIRRWIFLGIITLATICSWVSSVIWPEQGVVVLLWWNLCASYLALVIESVVGIGVFSQTKSDAIALREVRAISRHVEKMVERIEALEEVLDAHVNGTALEHKQELAAVKALTQEIHQMVVVKKKKVA